MHMAVLFLKDPNMVFIHIPKNAGTYFSNQIKMWSREVGAPRFIEHDLGVGPHVSIAELVSARAFERLGYEKIPDVVAIVRNPWSRVYSRYRFRRNAARQRILRRLGFKPVKPGISLMQDLGIVTAALRLGFSDWVLSDKSPVYGNGKYFQNRDQISWVEGVHKLSEVHFVRFEQFSSDVARLPLPLNQMPCAFRGNGSSDYREHYNDEAAEFIRKSFKRDIELFDYKF